MADIKISEATPAGTLMETDLVPIARAGTAAPFNASMADLANFVTVLATTHTPEMSSEPANAGKMETYARADHVHPTDQSRAPIDSPQFKGSPTAPTMAPSDSSTALATTRFVHDLGASGTLRTQTPGIDDNSELVATTEFVVNQGSTDPPLPDGVPTAGVSRRFSRGDHTHPAVASYVLPTASTTVLGGVKVDGTTVVVSGGVLSASAVAAAGVQSWNTRTGVVTLTKADVTGALAYTPYDAANPSGYQTLAQVRAGTTTNDNAAAGQIGEFISASVQSGAAIAATTGVALNITTISLTAGDWDVQGQVATVAASGGHINSIMAWTSTTSATPPTVLAGSAHQVGGIATGGIEQMVLPTGRMRLSLAATTTVYLSTTVNFTGTLSCLGYISARRMR